MRVQLLLFWSYSAVNTTKFRSIVECEGIRMEAFPAKLKGIQGEVELVRVLVGEEELIETLFAG